MQVNRPTEEQIRRRANAIYLQHGCQPGHDRDNWLQAEYELMQLPMNVKAFLKRLNVEITSQASDQKLMEILTMVIASLFPLGIVIMVLFKSGCFSDATSGEQISCLAAVATFLLLFWGGRLGYGMFPVIRDKQIRDAISFSGGVLMVLWMMIFAFIILPRCDFTVSQWMVTIFWGWFIPIGALGGLLWGIETAARKKGTIADS